MWALVPAEPGRATQAVADATATLRIVGVNRSTCGGATPEWRRAADLVSELPLGLYVEYKVGCGATRAEAEEQWRAARQIAQLAA